MSDLWPPTDLGYIKCDPCIDGNHDRCIGLKVDRPFCGCSLCPWLQRLRLVGDDE